MYVYMFYYAKTLNVNLEISISQWELELMTYFWHRTVLKETDPRGRRSLTFEYK